MTDRELLELAAKAALIDIGPADLWQLCGPTVEFNLRKVPLWQVFSIVYFEGLQHGVSGLVKLQKEGHL